MSFKTTRWSLVLAAADPADTQGHDALEALCRAYWPPLYAYLRRRGNSTEQAQDLCQGFFERLLTDNTLSNADRDRGRFRSFLLTALKHFAANAHRDANALKRGGGFALEPLDLERVEHRLSASDSDDPEVVYERQWAATVLDRVLGRLRADYKRGGRERLFDMLSPHLTGTGDSKPYADICVELSMSEGAVKVAVHRMRKRYGRLLRDEVAETLSDPKEVDDELRSLLGAL